MSRWEPDARGRLLDAAVELFAEHGYDATTAAQIAARAGLTKTTLFRHFADKREILFQGQEVLVALAAAGVESAAEESTPFELVHAGVLALSEIHVAERREIGRRIDSILSSSSELRERAAYKRSAITDALHQVLAVRTGDLRQAALLADIGMRAYYDGFARWIASSGDSSLGEIVSSELEAYKAVVIELSPKSRRDRSGRRRDAP